MNPKDLNEMTFAELLSLDLILTQHEEQLLKTREGPTPTPTPEPVAEPVAFERRSFPQILEDIAKRRRPD